MSDQPDPYQAPRADLDQGIGAPSSATSIEMPSSVKATVSVLIVTAIVGGYSGYLAGEIPLVRLAILGLVIWGVFRRSALAWQWIRVGSILGSMLMGAVSIIGLIGWGTGRAAGTFALGNGVLLLMAALFALPAFLLNTRRARDFFGVVCPTCGSSNVRAADFVYRGKRCGNCRATWR